MAFHLLTPFSVDYDSSQGHADWDAYIPTALLYAKLCCSVFSLPDLEDLIEWEQWEVNSKSRLVWGVNLMSHLFLVDAWFLVLVTQDYVHIFILSTLIVLRTLWLLVSRGMKVLQKCCPFMLFQNNVPKSNRRASSVVSRGFEESAVRFWSPLYELVKFPVNKQFFEDNILSVQLIQPTYTEGGLDFSSGWTRLPLKIKCWWDNFLQIQIIQCQHLARKIMQRTWLKYWREKPPSHITHLCLCPDAAVDTLVNVDHFS